MEGDNRSAKTLAPRVLTGDDQPQGTRGARRLAGEGAGRVARTPAAPLLYGQLPRTVRSCPPAPTPRPTGPGFSGTCGSRPPRSDASSSRGAADEHHWAIRRLLEYGEWDEIWQYLTLDAVEKALPGLRFRSPELESFWREAVARWRAHAA